MSSTLVRVAFGVLLLATVAAFFVTQQLKNEFPLVLRFAAEYEYFSPNGDGNKDVDEVGFDLSEPAEVSFWLVDSEGREVRQLVDGRRLAGDAKHRFDWDGRGDDGEVVPDGLYRMRLLNHDDGRVINLFKEVTVDTTPPDVALTGAEPSVVAFGPGQVPRVKVTYSGPRNRRPEFRVFRTDDGPPRVVRRFRGDDTRSGVWTGLVTDDTPADPGDYAFTVTVHDKAGNIVTAPAEIPSRRTARPGTGVSVRALTLTGPLDVVPAGSSAELTLGPIDRELSFVLSRAGDPKPVRTGERLGGAFRVHVPEDATTGLYLVRVRSGGLRAVWPLAVAGLPASKRAASRPRPLVVLPAITWQGLNPTDGDANGFPDTLRSSRSVPLDRPFAGGRLPAGLRREGLPLLEFLDRERLPYDLTTDVALARGVGPALGNAPGVAVAGSAIWLPPAALRSLRRYVDEGGTVASFGADSFKRSVRLADGRLSDPSRARARDAFGERTALLDTTNAPLAVVEDELGLFEGADDLVGDFSLFEQSDGLPRGSRALVNAGREPDRPAFVAYELGDGLVIRTGTPQWAGQLEESALGDEVPQVTRNLWDLLGRRR